ncbi:hypothetical protein HPP92_011856 [Vanilla planifolia]|uniref:WD repeat-containing protein 75 second beta-propeller domain-containing protein n=1 Tax=Vanilla planifolia TaxID=51239 RepID=A0A835V373_VANPL|nr:hypothetical protein HPP92_011856 [Vanilla planifolia]
MVSVIRWPTKRYMLTRELNTMVLKLFGMSFVETRYMDKIAYNRIHFLKMPKMELIRSISGIKLPFSLPNAHDSSSHGFAFHSMSGLIALPAEDYCIQFFSLFDNMEVSRVQICERNFQPVDDIMVRVSIVALSADGSTMGTIDVKVPEEGLGGLVTLKFWSCASLVGQYSLSTVIYEPHSDAQVSEIAFRPGYSMAVSTSLAGDFKVWVNSSNNGQECEMNPKSGWRCQSVGSYKKMPMTAAAFSADGSVLAIAVESIVTLWDADRNALIAVIGNSIGPICKVSFVANSQYLISLSRCPKPQFAVWDLSKLCMHWSYKLVVEAVSSTEYGTQFAILAINSTNCEAKISDLDGVILLFDLENPVPLSAWLVKKAKGGGLAFLSRDMLKEKSSDDGNSPLLAYVNGDHEYTIFDPSSKDDHIVRNARSTHVPDEEPERTGYVSIYGELPEFDIKRKKVSEIPFVPSERPWETIFSGSSHILPPLNKLCSTFFESLLEKRPTVNL